MRNGFGSNIILVLCINLLIKPIYIFGIDAEVQNVLGTNTYGLYFALFNFCFLFQFVLDLGIQNFGSRHLGEKNSRLIAFYNSAFSTKLVLVLLFLVSITLGYIALGFNLDNINLLYLIGVQMIIMSFVLFLRAINTALGNLRSESYFSSLDKFLLLLAMSYVLYLSPLREQLTLKTFLVIQIGTSLITLGIIVLFLSRKKILSKPSFTLNESTGLIKKSFPFALILLTMTLYTRMDGVMLKKLIADNNYQAGVYAAGFRIVDALNIIGFLFAGFLLPLFSSMTKKEEWNHLWSYAFRLLLPLISILCCSGIFYSEEIMSWLYSDYSIQYSTVLKILVCSFFANSLGYLFGVLLTAKANMYTLNMYYSIGIGINLILNLFLIPSYGSVGAAIATFFTQLIILILLIYLSCKELRFKTSWVLMLKSLLFVILSAAVFILIQHFIPWHWVIQMSFSALISFLVSFLLQILSVNYIKEII